MVTGGAQLIGAKVVFDWFHRSEEGVVNIDKRAVRHYAA